MKRSVWKLGLGTLLIVIAYFAVSFAWLRRDRAQQARIVDLTLERDLVENRLKVTETTNDQMRRMLESSRTSAASSPWYQPMGLDIETLPPKPRRTLRFTLEFLAVLDANPERWAALDQEAVVGRFLKAEIPASDAVIACESILRNGTEPRTRLGAAMLLGRMKRAYAADALEAGLKDESARVREASALALGEFSAVSINDALKHALLNDPSPEVRAAVAMAVTKGEGQAALDVLIKALRIEPSVTTRLAIVAAMNRSGGTKVVDLLSEGLVDPSPAVRAASEDAIAGRGTLATPIPGIIYTEISGDEYRSFLQSGAAKRITRQGDSIYFEVDAENRKGNTTQIVRTWYRAFDR